MKKLDLSGTWCLRPFDVGSVVEHSSFFSSHDSIPCRIPGDIQTALLDEGVIPDPFVGEQELEIQWVGQNDWVLEREFEFSFPDAGSPRSFLELDMADTLIDIYINARLCGKCFNQFRHWCFDVTEHLRAGANTMRLVFHSTEKEALKIASRLEYNIPYSEYPVFSPHRNLIRKTQCQAGWDWGPCIQCSGIYESICLNSFMEGHCVSNTMFPELVDGKWELKARVWYEAFRAGRVKLGLSCNSSAVDSEQDVVPGMNEIEISLGCPDVILWWPNGYGEQPVYEARLTVDDGSGFGEAGEFVRLVGFRTLVVKCQLEADGKRPLTICVNGVEVFAKGANWIPMDSFPSRWTPERYHGLLGACRDANMNAVRLWGGGLYEHEAFYEECDRLGILIWHDCMFSCSMYPADPDFLANVEKEIEFQARRIQSHPALALWCGNNEDVGAIGWYEESRNNPERYIRDFEKLNYETVGRVMKKEDPHHLWWPSSPCGGEKDYSDNWHSDGKGDMHIWSVWHDGEPFEFYRTFKPRFASEFGFQSFPSLSTIGKYAPGKHERLDAPELSHHQKNPAGNSIISGNFQRYFNAPKDFPQMVYLSQVQQAMAMQMAISYWRTLIPYCMGTLYWQINETWPGCSWAGIEHSGKWRLLHYEARRFYQSVAAFAFVDDGVLKLRVVNDLPSRFDASAELDFFDFFGNKVSSRKFEFKLDGSSCFQAADLDVASLGFSDREVFCVFSARAGKFESRSWSFLCLPKDAALQDAGIRYRVTGDGNKDGFEIELSAQKPAFHVSLDTSLEGSFSDNGLLLIPGEKAVVRFEPEKKCLLQKFMASLKIYDLRGSFKS